MCITDTYFGMAEAGLSGSNLSGQRPWSSMPQALPPERPRAKVSTSGSAVMELPGGVRIHFQDQPASFVAACAIELGLVGPLIAPVAQPQQRAKDTAASPATTATTASKRRDRKKASQRRWKQKEEEEATSMFSFQIINYSNYSLPLYYSLNLELEAAYPFGTWFKNL